MKKLYLAWRDTRTRRYYPVGRLTQVGEHYQFVYLRGALEAAAESQFQPFPSFPDFDKPYEADELFPLFINRVMPQSRPDYPNYVQWLRMEGRSKDPLAFLEQSGGTKATDTLEIFPDAAKIEGGIYRLQFFVHGLRHMSPDGVERAGRLVTGERLLLQWDAQNPIDPGAISLRTCAAPSGDASMVGYCPRYLNAEIRLALDTDLDSCVVTVIGVNPPPAPAQLRVLCQMDLLPSSSVIPFQSEAFLPLTGEE